MPRPSWYLDPEVALQKRRVHQELVRRWVGVRPEGVVLKTDLFEEAWGHDRIYGDLFEAGGAVLLGTDIAEGTVARASAVGGVQRACGFVCDLRQFLTDGGDVSPVGVPFCATNFRSR